MNAAPVAQAGWCLRFLTGALKGRTIALKPGANALGSGGDCEVMLPGGDVLPRHLVLTVGELVVSAQKVGTAAVELNGEEMKQQRRSVVAGDVVTVGKIEFQLDRSYPAQAQDDRMFADADDARPGDDAQPLPAAARRGTGFWAGAGLLMLATAGLLGVAMTAANPRAATGGGAARIADVERALAGFGEVEVVAAPGGQLNVKGFVESHLRKQALQQALQPFGTGVSVNVHAADDLVEQARRYVGDPAVAVSYAGHGRLVVSGATEDETVRQKVRRLGEDLHPTVLVSDKLQYKPAPQADQEADVRAQWAAWQSVLPGRLVSITEDASGLRHVQLANGTRYYEGSLLKSGAEIQRIEGDGLVLSAGPKPEGTK